MNAVKFSKLHFLPLACLVFSIGAGLSACHQTKQLDEMHDSTIEMKDTTKRMNDGLSQQLKMTDKMAKNLEAQLEISGSMNSKLTPQLEISKGLATSIDATYLDLRQGNGRNLRRDELKNVQHAKTMDAKFTASVAYLIAFEYQLIKPDLDSADGRTETLYASAAEEFLRDINELLPKPWSYPMLSDSGSATENAYAIAATLHFINPNSQAACSRRGDKCVSMLDLLESALQKKSLKQENLPAYVTKVLEQEEVAVYLLKLRYVALSSIILHKASPLGEFGISEFSTLLRGGRLLIAPWTPSLGRLNPSQLAQVSEFSNYAHQIYDFLLSIHQAPILPLMVKAAYQNMRPQVADAKKNAGPNDVETQLNLQLIEIQNLALNSDCASNALFCLRVRGSAPSSK